MKSKVLLVLIVCCCPLITHTKATQCLLESTLDSAVRPKFFRNTKTHIALISNQSQWIHLDHNEEIIGHCKTQFINAHTTNSQIKISCRNGAIVIKDDYYNSYNTPSSHKFECTPQTEKVVATCSIPSTPNRAVRPKFFKKIGTRSIQISPEVETINIKYDQEITVRCETKFKSPNHLSTELKLMCLNGKILLLDHPYAWSTHTFECASLQWNVYESATPFPWCPSSMASYILARPWVNNDYEYLAGICYDIEKMSFKSLYYAAKPKFVKYLSPTKLTTFKPLMEITDINSNFVSKRTFIYDNPQIEKWIEFSNYKIKTIVQNPKLYHHIFLEFSELLNIDWWSGLQLGNWGFYEEALVRHINSDVNEYDILAGISNVVTAPIRQESCNKNLTMTELADSANNKLPLYIWNYLKSTRNDSDDVVVIGVNSPFYDFYDEKDVIFCTDICHQIDWLQNIHSSFRYRPMGVIFCCSLDEVMAAGRLDGFAIPKISIPPPSLPLLNYNFSSPDTTTPESVDSTVYDETTKMQFDEYSNLY